jgi:hypothetical protein
LYREYLERTDLQIQYLGEPDSEEAKRARAYNDAITRQVSAEVEFAINQINELIQQNAEGELKGIENTADLFAKKYSLELASQGPQDKTLTINVYLGDKLVGTLTQFMDNKWGLSKNVRLRESADFDKAIDNWLNSPSPMSY